ncbi:MAG: asparagine synthase (glutamine-hydrolyzing) [Kiritimatiellae bacterium]|nr:asparagine synthase (glutamine-hydrolyzing) [Kiritimatiellia bacterium]MDD4734674.1 asparagine synthase (glutamine-hydrolyzing) [Kiritimatiellia bacterium]
MCGICGFNWNDAELARRMALTIAHRGPDQEGVFACGDWSFAHRRLSIIDLSEHGRQPMGNEDGSVQIVFNGEIYNFQELREELVGKGHVFASHSDTEVIVHGYEEYGEEIIPKLRGIFAFAIWDARSGTFLMARDHIGVKPVYYYERDGRFVFGSEIKAMLEAPCVPRELNRQALFAYIGCEFVPAPETMFRHIMKLPAGHYLIRRGGKTEIREYWDLEFPEEPSRDITEGEAIERIRGLLDDAVRSQLVSDVPLGAFLSGGLDSSTIVAMMRRHVTGPLRTFTIGYQDKTFSELEYAQIVADQFGTEHHVLMIDEMTEELIEKSLWHFDEPMTDLSSIPLMLICQEAKKDITVCLSGEGGDEVFVGYDRFKASKMNSWYSLLPRPLRQPVISGLVGLLPDQPQKKGAINMLKRFIEGSCLPEEGRHLRWQYFSNARQDAALFNESFRGDVNLDGFARLHEYDLKCRTRDRVNREAYLDTRYQMTDSVLMKVDRMSMANSLEIRVPLLDHRLLEYLALLPGDWKLKGMQTKYIFRKALEGMLPNSIIYRGKQGYSLPVKNFLRTQLKGFMISLLNESPVIRENMNLPYVNQLIDEHLAMKHNHNHVLWGLIHTAIWHRRFLEQS